MSRIVSLLIGYLLGSFLTAELVVGKITGRSPFTYGSHNPGMVNVKRREGLGWGLVVLFGDLLKTGLACAVSYWLFGQGIWILWAGVGAVLGHDFPFWHRFHGGEGVASMAAAMILYHPLIGAGCCLLGWAVVLCKGGLPLAAVVIPALFAVSSFVRLGWEAGVLGCVLLLLMLQRQRKVNKFGAKKDE